MPIGHLEIGGHPTLSSQEDLAKFAAETLRFLEIMLQLVPRITWVWMSPKHLDDGHGFLLFHSFSPV